MYRRDSLRWLVSVMIAFAALATSFATAVYAQQEPEQASPWDTLSPYLELRLRPLWLSDGNDLGGDLTLNLRTRAGLRWEPDERLVITAVFQDMRAFALSDSPGSLPPGPHAPQTGKTDLYLGNLEWAPLDGLTLLMGRQELAYDDQRLVGALDWFDQGRQFDALRLRLGARAHNYDAFSLDIFWAPITFADEPAEFGEYDRQFAGVHATIPTNDEMRLSAYAYHLAARSPQPVHTFTLGTYHARLPHKGFRYQAVAAVQVNGDVLGEEMAFAWAVHGTLGFGFQALRLMAEVNAASGDTVTTGASRAFNNLFPTNHNKYGYIDRQNWSNTFNVALRGWYDTPVSWAEQPVTVELSVWAFWPQIYSGGSDVFLGQMEPGSSGLKALEFDLRVTHRCDLGLGFTFGTSVWVPGAVATRNGFGDTDVFLYGLVGITLS